MVGIKNNRRTQYTIQTLKRALLTLLQQEPLAKVTVTQICQEADINRGTFYLHFDNPDNLFEAIENDIFDQISPLLKVQPKDDLQDWGRRLVLVVEDNAVAMRIMLSMKRTDKIIDQIFAQAHELFMHEFTAQGHINDHRLLEYYFTFFVSGSVGALEKWLSGEDKISSDELAKIIVNLELLKKV